MNVLIIALAVIAAPAILIFIAAVISVPLTLAQICGEWADRRKLRREFDKKIKVLEQIAMESDGVEKGFAVARLLHCAYEKKMI